MATRLDRPARTWSATACVATVLCWSLASASAAVAKTPALTAPRVGAQGATVALSVSPRGGHSCRLTASGYDGRRQSRRLLSGGPFTAYIDLTKNAHAGTWKLQVRCGARRSATKTLRVTGAKGQTARLLIARLTMRRLGGKQPDGFSNPRRAQNGKGAPGTGLTKEDSDGRGGSDGGRGARAIEWALAQQGRTDFNGWCLRFVAAAYGQSTSYPTATIGANALGPRDGSGPATLAPAGSLVWFNWVDPRDGVNYGHVGISLGNGTMINALDTVRIEPIDGSTYWRSRYRGWTPAPTSWPGRPGPVPVDPVPLPVTTPTPTPTTPAPVRKILTVDNRTTNGMSMRQDGVPLRLTTQPRTFCTTNGCNINGTERMSGDTYDAAVCQTTGDRFTNGNDSDPADDANPERFESTRYYGVRLTDGTFGYVSEVWIRAADRGGLGLPAC
jgi:hypothetical protein